MPGIEPYQYLSTGGDMHEARNARPLVDGFALILQRYSNTIIYLQYLQSCTHGGVMVLMAPETVTVSNALHLY